MTDLFSEVELNRKNKQGIAIINRLFLSPDYMFASLLISAVYLYHLIVEMLELDISTQSGKKNGAFWPFGTE